MKDREMISCQEAAEKVYEYLDGELDGETTEQVRGHIEMCKKCYPYFNFERIFLDHIRSQANRDESSKALEEKVMKMLAEID